MSIVAKVISAEGAADDTAAQAPAGNGAEPTLRASVIIPSTSGGAPLERLLRSIETVPDETEVIVVDNGSANGTITALAGGFAHVRVIALEENAGFGRAVNLAAEQARGRAIVLLNDDCVADPGFVEAILRPLSARAGVTMVSGVLREAGQPWRIDLAGIGCGLTLMAFPYLNGEPLAAAEIASPPVGPAGAAAAFDREAFLRVGGFDDALFAYGEDLDLALRMRADGGTCALAIDAMGTHAHSSTLGTGSARKNYLAGFARGYTVRKWSVLKSPGRMLRVLLADLVVCSGQALADRNLAGVAGRLAGYRAVTRSRPFPGEALLASPAGDGPLRMVTRRVSRRRRLHRQVG